jgi:hypothetical protein
VSATPYTDADIEYVTRDFVRLDDLCRGRDVDPDEVRAHVAAGRLPRPAYVLPDGGEMVPDTYFALADEAGGAQGLQAEFGLRYEVAAAAEGVEGDADEEWEAYLSGEYGVCLLEVTPEAIVRKTALMKRIEELLGSPTKESAEWATALRASVGELDELERPFAPHYDRLRFGGPSSRDRLITGVRAQYPDVVATVGPPATV